MPRSVRSDCMYPKVTGACNHFNTGLGSKKKSGCARLYPGVHRPMDESLLSGILQPNHPAYFEDIVATVNPRTLDFFLPRRPQTLPHLQTHCSRTSLTKASYKRRRCVSVCNLLQWLSAVVPIFARSCMIWLSSTSGGRMEGINV